MVRGLTAGLAVLILCLPGLALSSDAAEQLPFDFQMYNSSLVLLARADVRRDIELSDEQHEQMGFIRRDAETAMQLFAARVRARGADLDALREEYDRMQDSLNQRVEGVLTEAQTKRLREIGIQLQGPRALFERWVQDELGFDGEQRERASRLRTDYEAALQSLMGDFREMALSREELLEKIDFNEKVLKEELDKVVTADQAEKLKKLQGKPFERDDELTG